MLFNREVKADYSTPGLKWNPTDNGGVAGRVYTALPTRLKRALKKAAVIGVIWMLFTTSTELPDDVFFAAAFSNFLDGATLSYLFFALWPFWPFVRRFKMEGEHFIYGGRRYALRDIGTFQTQRKSFKPLKFDEILIFHFGRKTIKINVPNKYENTLRMAEFLNWARQGLLERGTLIRDDEPGPEEARAAAF